MNRLFYKCTVQRIGLITNRFYSNPFHLSRKSIVLTRRYGSNSHNHHDHFEPKDPYPEEKTKRLWILISALVFLPIVR